MSRNQIQLSEAAELAIGGVIGELKEQIRVFSQERSDSRFALYNTAASEAGPPPVENWHWLCQHETEPRFEWRPLQFPAVAPIDRDGSALAAASAYRSAVRVVKRIFPDAPQVQQKERSAIPIDEYRSAQQTLSRYCGVTVSTQPPNRSPSGDEPYSHEWGMSTTWHSPNLAPTRVVAIVLRHRRPWGLSADRRIGMLWEEPPKWQQPRVAHPETEFPPEWQSLCVIVDPPQRIWNRSHKLVRATSGQAWKELMESPCRGGDPRPWASELTSNAELAAAWFLFCLSTGNASLVQGVAEHSPELLQAMWEVVFPDEELSECWAKIDDSRGDHLVKIGPIGWEDYDATAANEAVYATHFPEPGVDSCVYGVDRSTHDT